MLSASLLFPISSSSVFSAVRYRLAAAWYRLQHFQGPFLASFSYLFIANSQRSGRTYKIYTDLNKRYGPLVRIGPNKLATDDPDVIRKMSSARSTYRRS